MQFRVRHLLRYSYDAPVALGPHLLRLTPRGAVRMAHGIRVRPEPGFQLETTDDQGNAVTRIGFSGQTRALEIEMRFELNTRGLRPPPAGPDVPARYLKQGEADDSVTAAARRMHDLAGREPRGFAESLCTTLHGSIAHEPNEALPLKPPGETLASARGTTRDIARLYVELARRAGLPARFVSGYWAAGSGPAAARGARVWAEVYLPDRGWMGFDPGTGQRTGLGHVPLAASAELSGTLPVSGTTFNNAFGLTVRVRPSVDLTILTAEKGFRPPR